jgi:hypothetical protein
MESISRSDKYDVELLTASVIDPNAVPMRLWPCLRNPAMSSFDQVLRPGSPEVVVDVQPVAAG